MFTKKIIWVFLILLVSLWYCVVTSSVYGTDRTLESQLLAHAGKSFMGVQDPGYLAYDLALRDYMVERISKRFGISLDPKIYSGFDLLEIEALFKCKKSDESFDIFLKMFSKRP